MNKKISQKLLATRNVGCIASEKISHIQHWKTSYPSNGFKKKVSLFLWIALHVTGSHKTLSETNFRSGGLCLIWSEGPIRHETAHVLFKTILSAILVVISKSGLVDKWQIIPFRSSLMLDIMYACKHQTLGITERFFGISENTGSVPITEWSSGSFLHRGTPRVLKFR